MPGPGTTRRRGRPAGVSRSDGGSSGVERIVAEALTLIRSEGVAALSMRRLAQQIGVDPALAYYYVKSKDQLLDLVIDASFADFPRSWEDAEDWRDALRGWAFTYYDFLIRHRGFAELLLARPVPTPRMLEQFDALLGRLRDAGFDRGEAVLGYISVHNVVSGRVWVDVMMSSRFADRDEARRLNGSAYRALLESVPEEVAPNFVWLGDAASEFDVATYLSFAVDAIIDRLAADLDG